MDPCETAATVTAIACAIYKCVPREELPAMLSTLGQLAATLGNMLRVGAVEAEKQAAVEEDSETPADSTLVNEDLVPVESIIVDEEILPIENILPDINITP